MTFEILQPHTGPIPADVYLPASPETVTWGRLPSRADAPVLTVPAGTTVTIDTVSHEGILEDQGKDPLGYFTGHGVVAASVLDDAVVLTAPANVVESASALPKDVIPVFVKVVPAPSKVLV